MSLIDDWANSDYTEEELYAALSELPDHVVNILATEHAGGSLPPAATVLDEARMLDEGYRTRAHLEYISERLTKAVHDVEAGQSRKLVISSGPRTGKSHMTSTMFPLWLLHKHPEWKIGLVSHSPELATSWGRAVRRIVEDSAGQLGVNIAHDAGAVSDWETTQGGKVVSRSMPGQSMVGFGFKCFHPDTVVDTERGKENISSAFLRGAESVLSYNHGTGRQEYKHVAAFSRTKRGNLVEIRTQAGRTLKVTEDHPIYTQAGYTPAGDLTRGDQLITLSPQHPGDTVSSVTPLPGSHTVYDLQIEDNHNLFADGILAHNCALIDDPTKNFATAHSKEAQDKIWNYWLNDLYTRLEPPSLVVVIATRWTQDDLIGRLLSDDYQGDPNEWERITLPVIAEQHDILGREPGEPIISPIVEETPEQALERWAEIRTAVGEYTWASQYQQRPAPAEGSIFKIDGFRYWTTDPDLLVDGEDTVRLINPADMTGERWLDSWDAAFKGTDSSDYVVGQRWVVDGKQRFLVDQKRGRWSFTDTLHQMRAWETEGVGHDLVYEKLIEDKANGPAIIDTLKDEIDGIKPITPKSSKEARARSVTPEVEAGSIYLPHPQMPGFEWVRDFVSEVRDFPHGEADDQVDAFTQVLNYVRSSGAASVTVPTGTIGGRGSVGRVPRRGSRSNRSMRR